MNKGALLLTCFNRIDCTLKCLGKFYSSILPDNVEFDVFLVDDGSTDGTGEKVKLLFPKVKVINGTGNLFWNGGMRLAWENAVNTGIYDFFLWLNDDTYIKEDSLINLFNDYEVVGKDSLITGVCVSPNTKELTYGGRNKDGFVYLEGTPIECTFINGNIVLVPNCVFQKIGNLSTNYTHAMGDFDYGLRAQKKGIKCYSSSQIVAECLKNPIPQWYNSKVPLKKRWKFLHSPKGLNLKEYLVFQEIHFGKVAKYRALIKVYLKTLWPEYYEWMKSRM